MKHAIGRLALVLTCLTYSVSVYAQPEPPTVLELDHFALHVQDLQKSAEFYSSVLGLAKLTDPFKDGRHTFFRLGVHVELHLIAGAPQPSERDIDVHLAFRVKEFKEFLSRLDQLKIRYFSTKHQEHVITLRPDGVQQVYLQDPDGYWIEINRCSE